jgi:hypothetical protein
MCFGFTSCIAETARLVSELNFLSVAPCIPRAHTDAANSLPEGVGGASLIN